MSTAAAPVATRSSALARAVVTGELTPAMRSIATRAPASVRRCARDDVTASSAMMRPSAETTSAPRTRSPGRRRGSRPPQIPQLTTKETRILVNSSSLARSDRPSPQIAKRPGLAAIAASRFKPLMNRALAAGVASVIAERLSFPAESRFVHATSSPARQRRRRRRESRRTRRVGSPGRSPCR